MLQEKSGTHMKNRKGRLAILIAAFAGLFFVSPSLMHMFAPKADPYQYKCNPLKSGYDPDKTKRPSPSPVVKTISLTDDGELVDRCQWTDALNELVKEREGGPKQTLAVVYVHGWKHNEISSDKTSFTKFISRLEKLEGVKDPLMRRHVVGIYVSWDAALRLPTRLLENLTFWSRKRAADRIAQSAMVAKLVGAIDHIQKMTDTCSSASPPTQCLNRTFLIGHSFGARILHSATSPLLIHETQQQHPGKKGKSYGCIRGPADAVVLINPAIEASMFTAFDSLRRNEEKFSHLQQPRLFMISTENDWATKGAFPIGQLFGWLRGARNTTTIGNYVEYHTHVMERLALGTKENAQRGTSWSDRFCATGICLRLDVSGKSGKAIQPNNPFIFATTKPDVIDGHNGHWTSNFSNWLSSLILKIDQEEKSSMTEICSR
jgi:hypothetical protein